MTRAQALLIVIGDPNVLSLDPLWRSFLNYVYNNGGWTGHLKPSWDTTDVSLASAEILQTRRQEVSKENEDLMKRITDTIDGVIKAEDMDDLGDLYDAIERPWWQAE